LNLLLKKVAEANAQDKNGLTASHLAAAGGGESTARVLHLASAALHDSTIQALLQEFRADKKAKNECGRVALHLLAENIYACSVFLTVLPSTDEWLTFT
jgi:ankyrin repeat protein